MSRGECGAARWMGVLGMILGAVVAVLVPAVVLKFGNNVGMGSFAATILVISGLTGGVILAVASAFFAIVIPSPQRHGDTETRRRGEQD